MYNVQFRSSYPANTTTVDLNNKKTSNHNVEMKTKNATAETSTVSAQTDAGNKKNVRYLPLFLLTTEIENHPTTTMNYDAKAIISNNNNNEKHSYQHGQKQWMPTDSTTADDEIQQRQ
jgi:hypothetical protein